MRDRGISVSAVLGAVERSGRGGAGAPPSGAAVSRSPPSVGAGDGLIDPESLIVF